MKLPLLFAAIHGFLSVALGAFAAHALAARLDEKALAWMETGTRYQMFHALALLGTAWLATRLPGNLAPTAAHAFFWGAAVFSGSLYAMALGAPRWLGAVTPLGGLALLAGWLLLGLAALRGA